MTDIRLYGSLRVIFTNLFNDLRNTQTRRANWFPGEQKSERQFAPEFISAVVLDQCVRYTFDKCEIVFSPQVDVLKGLTPNVDQLLEQLGTSTIQFIKSVDNVVRVNIERLACIVKHVSDLAAKENAVSKHKQKI